MRTMNIRALAIRQNPDLLKRGGGKLHWESSVSKRLWRSITHQGNEAALKAYIDQNREELEREARALREVSKSAAALTKTELPLTSEEWAQLAATERQGPEAN